MMNATNKTPARQAIRACLLLTTFIGVLTAFAGCSGINTARNTQTFPVAPKSPPLQQPPTPQTLTAAKPAPPSSDMAQVTYQEPSPAPVSKSSASGFVDSVYEAEIIETEDPFSLSSPVVEGVQTDVTSTPYSAGEQAASVYPIDLANALGLAGGSHLQIRMARERIIQAQADLTQARALWLPSLRFGVGWNKHDGRIQQTQGEVLEASRGSLFVGGGAGLGQVPLAGGAGGPARLMVNLSVADAVFQPKVMQNLHFAAAEESKAIFNNSLLQVAHRYLDLVEVHGRYANAQIGVEALQNMVMITSAFEASGEATQVEVERARTQHALQKRSLANLDRQTRTQSAELVRLLRMDPNQLLVPAEVQVAPVEVVDATLPIPELLAIGLASRPETCQQQALIWAAGQRVQQEQWRPWLPNVQVGTSAGNFGGGEGSDYTNSSGRSDVDLLAVWEVQNLGYGNKALRQRSCSERREASLQAQWIRNQIEAEIVAAANDVNGYRDQVSIAQEAAELARATYEKNRLSIREGEGLPLELIQAISSMVQSLDAYVTSVSDYNRAQFRLLRAIGQTPPS